MYFGNYLKRWLAVSDERTQGDISRNLGISRQAVSQYISGKMVPKFETGYVYMVKLEASKDELKGYVKSFFEKLNVDPSSVFDEIDITLTHFGNQENINNTETDKSKAIKKMVMESISDIRHVPLYKQVDDRLEIVGYVQSQERTSP